MPFQICCAYNQGWTEIASQDQCAPQASEVPAEVLARNGFKRVSTVGNLGNDQVCLELFAFDREGGWRFKFAIACNAPALPGLIYVADDASLMRLLCELGPLIQVWVSDRAADRKPAK